MTATDRDILDCLRTGCRTPYDIAYRLDGLDSSCTGRDLIEYRARCDSYAKRLNRLAKYGIVRKTGFEVAETGMRRTTFEVVE